MDDIDRGPSQLKFLYDATAEGLFRHRQRARSRRFLAAGAGLAALIIQIGGWGVAGWVALVTVGVPMVLLGPLVASDQVIRDLKRRAYALDEHGIREEIDGEPGATIAWAAVEKATVAISAESGWLTVRGGDGTGLQVRFTEVFVSDDCSVPLGKVVMARLATS